MPQPYHITLPGNGSLHVYVHRLMNYRYHWHPREYELCVLLSGQAAYSRGQETIRLGPGDLLAVDPSCGHASYALEPHARALVLRCTPGLLRPAAQGSCPSFHRCVSGSGACGPAPFRQIRQCAASVLLELERGDPRSAAAVGAWMTLLGITLDRYFSSGQTITLPGEADTRRGKRVEEYIGQHYAEKLTLDSLARFTGYNRTYLSTFFKSCTGTNFHEYLTRIRFQHAVEDLTYTGKTLTDVALDNGFPELKLFNARFRAAFQLSPAEYRARLRPDGAISPVLKRSYCPLTEDGIAGTLQRWAEGGGAT